MRYSVWGRPQVLFKLTGLNISTSQFTSRTEVNTDEFTLFS